MQQPEEPPATATIALTARRQEETFTTSHPDKAVLVTFYNATNGNNWTNKTNWLSDKPLEEWYGVSTYSNGSVVELSLDYNNLSGVIPSQLANLNHLLVLNLASNNLTGALPSSLGSYDNLIVLELQSNNLDGAIPSSLGDLDNLLIANLGSNKFSGSIPPQLGKISSLQQLYLNHNNLSGFVPSQLGELSQLVRLYLNDNNLSGMIPSQLLDLKSVSALFLAGNNFAGCIPGGLADLARSNDLPLLRMPTCGVAPAMTATTTSAENPTATATPVAATSHEATLENVAKPDQAALVALYNATNGNHWIRNDGWLSSKPLNQWYGVDTDSNGRVTNLNLRNNNLSGLIPAALENLSRLISLNLSNNDLRGSIPSQLGNLGNLQHLYLNDNDLTGTIPPFLGGLGLTHLFLANNNFSGCIPLGISNSVNSNDLLYLNIPACTTPTLTAISRSPENRSTPLGQSDSDKSGARPGQPGAPQQSTDSSNPDRPVVKVAWAFPSDEGASRISEFELHYTTHLDPIGRRFNVPHSNQGATTAAVSIRSLPTNTWYYIRVRAKNSSGYGPWSPTSSFILQGAPNPTPASPPTETPANTRPGLPTNIYAKAIAESNGRSSISIYWSEPDYPGHPRLHAYQVRYRKPGQGWADVDIGNSAVFTLGPEQATHRVRHEFQVRAINRVGESNWSSSVYATPLKAPEAPREPALIPGDGEIRVNWTAPNSPDGSIRRYEILYVTNGKDAIIVENVRATSYTITGVTNNKEYKVAVRAVNDVDAGKWSFYSEVTPTGDVLGLPLPPNYRNVRAPSPFRQSLREGTFIEILSSGRVRIEWNLWQIGDPPHQVSDKATRYVVEETRLKNFTQVFPNNQEAEYSGRSMRTVADRLVTTYTTPDGMPDRYIPERPRSRPEVPLLPSSTYGEEQTWIYVIDAFDRNGAHFARTSLAVGWNIND